MRCFIPARASGRPGALDVWQITANVTSVIRNPDESGDWVELGEASRILGMPERELRELVDCERLPTLESSGEGPRFRRSDVERLRAMWDRGESDDCLDAALAR